MILTVIPARSGSKRIPDKNLQKIGGKTLVEWACLMVQDRGVCSTDDRRIADIASKYVEVLWRPANLADDQTSAMAVWQHACSHYEWDLTILLQPSTPTRQEIDILQCLDALEEYDSACTLSPIPDRFEPRKAVSRHLGRVKLTQINRTMYTRDGACFAATHRGLWSFYSNCRGVLSKNPQVNIDEPIDLIVAEHVMQGSVPQNPLNVGVASES